MTRTRKRLLQLQQLIDFQVGTVGKRHKALGLRGAASFSSNRLPVTRLVLVALVAAATLGACSGGSRGSEGSAANPVAFPLFGGSEVLSAHSWHDTIAARPGTADSAIFAQGAGTYDGHDVVAGTQAVMPALEAWLEDLGAHPPDDYRVAVTGSGIDAAREHARDLGLDFIAFENSEAGKRHGVVVMVVDPETLDAKIGPLLGLIGRFKHVPKMWRDPLDAQAKKQTGFSISEATDPDTPIGAAIAALDDLRNYGGRGIVLIDAVKQ